MTDESELTPERAYEYIRDTFETLAILSKMPKHFPEARDRIRAKMRELTESMGESEGESRKPPPFKVSGEAQQPGLTAQAMKPLVRDVRQRFGYR